MSWYLPIRLPVFWEETRRRMRGGRGFAVLAGYNLALLGLLLFIAITNPVGREPTAWAAFGRALWHTFFLGQLAVIFLIAPGVTATAISAEREHQTLDLLFLSPQSTFALVLGKFLGAITQMLVVVISGLPVISIVFFYGGVSPAEVLKGYFTILLSGLFFATLGFLASCLFTRVSLAVAWAYGFLLIYCLGLPLLLVLLIVYSNLGFGFNDQFIYGLAGPLAHLISYFEDGEGFWSSAISTGVGIVLMLAACMVIIRRLRGASPLRLRPHRPPTAPAPLQEQGSESNL